MCLALCLGVVCFALAGNAWAGGTTRLSTTAVLPSTYASESTIVPFSTTAFGVTTVYGNTYKLVNSGYYSSDVYRDMGLLRTTAQNFYVLISLQNGAVFQGPGGAGGTACPTGMTCRLPATGDIPAVSLGVGGASGAATFAVAGTVATGSNSVAFLSTIGTSFTQLPTLQILAGSNAWTIRDVSNRLASGRIQVLVQTYDATTLDLVDAGSDYIDLAGASTAVTITNPVSSTTALVNVNTLRQQFVPAGGDTFDTDNGATLGIGYTASPVAPLNYQGLPFTLTAADTVKLTFTGTDLSGLIIDIVAPGLPATSTTPGIKWAGIPAGYTAGNTRTLNVAGNDLAINSGPRPITFQVDGVTSLSTRTISVKVDLALAGYSPTNLLASTQNGTPAAAPKSLMGTTAVTSWTLNGTVLMANWLNGNWPTYNSRIYLWNPSSLAGDVTVRLFKMPAVPADPATNPAVTSVELTTPGSPLFLGTLSGYSGMSIKLKEDILSAAAVLNALPGKALPYTENGGNLLVEVTIRADRVTGTSQVFNQNATQTFGQVVLTPAQ